MRLSAAVREFDVSGRIKSLGTLPRFASFGRWLTLIMGATLLMFGLPMLLGGIYLAGIGGSLYYMAAGAAFGAAGVQLIRERRSGYLVFLAALDLTAVWAFFEVGWAPWGLLPRLLVFLVIAIVCWLLWRWIDPRLTPERPSQTRWRRLAAAIFTFAVVGLAAAALFHNAGGRDAVADTIRNAGGEAHAVTAINFAADDGEWRQYGRTIAGQRWSPLADVTPSNVGKLQRAWVFHTGAAIQAKEELPYEFMFEATPIMVRDRLVLCTPHAEAVAVDPVTGRELWRFAAVGDRAAAAEFRPCRGVSYDETPGAVGLCAHRVLFATTTARLYALDLESGRRCPNFGRNGEVDLTAGIGLVKPGFYYVSSPPAIIHGKAVLGGFVWDNAERGEPSGVVRAFDTATGRLAWAFDVGRLDRNTLPPAGEHYSRGTPNVWAPISADPALGLVYLPTGNETPDFFGGGRQAASEQFSSSLVAVDADTGKLRWRQQTTHHDLWDYDVPAQPVLVDLPERPGAIPTPAVLVPTKRGEVFVYDRRTGRPLTRIVERPAPQATAPGDRAAPTQPYPDFPSLRPPRLTEAQMWGVTPLDQLGCRILFHSYRYDGPFTPPSVKGSLVYPGSTGVFEWGGVSVDPTRNIMYANTSWTPFIDQLIPRTDAGHASASRVARALIKRAHVMRFGGAMRGTPYGATVFPMMSLLRVPCVQPPWGHMTAIDLQSRTILWRHPIGTARDNGPLGARTGLPLPVGAPNIGGSVVTRSGLVFVGATADKTFRALDAQTGRELWRDYLPAGAQATPSIYRARDGHEYIVVAAGGHTYLSSTLSDALIAYRLP